MIMNSHFPSWLSWKEQSVSCAATSAPAMRVEGTDLVFLNGSFPGAVFVDTHGREVFDFPSNGVVRKSLKPPEHKKKHSCLCSSHVHQHNARMYRFYSNNADYIV